MIADAQAPKRQSEVESAKQRLDNAIAMATESFALLRTRLVPVMCPRPCALDTEQKQEPEAVPPLDLIDRQAGKRSGALERDQLFQPIIQLRLFLDRLVGDLNAMTRSVEQLNSRIQLANEELEL